MTSTDTTDKPFTIEKRRVYEAYKAVKSNKGAAGVDGQTIEQFEADLKGNLYKIWNRMSSGTYFPPPVRAVSIPKKSGGERILGVPTVSDRIAQMVVKQLIEPDLDPIFLPNSYGYRPRKSALDAVGVTRERCWKYDWVLEFDIRGLFDNIDHELLLRWLIALSQVCPYVGLAWWRPDFCARLGRFAVRLRAFRSLSFGAVACALAWRRLYGDWSGQ